jgi:hypothetical protein
MTEKVRVCIHGAEKVLVLKHNEYEGLGMGTNTALSMNSGCDPLENVNVLSSTFVTL